MAATRTLHNGIQYDSLTELNFHLAYPHLIRNTESFILWTNHMNDDTITYTPDFYDPKTKTWIEIKGTYKQFMSTEFQLRWKLAKAYFEKLEALIYYQSQWINTSQYNTVRHRSLLKAQEELKEIDKLANLKTLFKGDKWERLLFLLTEPQIAWKGLKRGSMVPKRVKYMALRAKLLKAKDKKQTLQDNL